METVIITTLISTAAAGISALVSWFLSKRKYNSEVENSNIKNMKESFEFYKSILDDNKKRIDEELAKIAFLEKQLSDQQQEITSMKNQMLAVYGQVCLNFKCMERIPYDDKDKNKAKEVSVKK